MGNYSKLITALPVIFGLLLVGFDYLVDDETFVIRESHIELVEVAIGGTILGGTANAGFKRYTQYKTKLMDSGH